MMAFSDKPAVKAVFAYLSSQAGGSAWAETGFDVSPNALAEEAYTDEALKKRAQLLYQAEALVPDIGDSIPGGFGTAEWAAIINYVNGGDLDQSLSQAAAVQAEATGQ
jgi:alpha-glucoside transport system substrate-binding protein